VITPDGLRCHNCQEPLDVRLGQWVAANPHATWGRGYWIKHLMVPWLGLDDIMERQAGYDPVTFLNECLGLPTSLGDQAITREEMEACCGEYPMARSLEDIPRDRRRRLVAGIDWGGGAHSATVIVIGEAQPDLRFTVFYVERLPVREDSQRVLEIVAQRCRQFGVAIIGADGGGHGVVYNRLLLDRIGNPVPLFAIQYSAADHDPARNGALWRWTVHRSASIGVQFTRIKKRLLVLPRLADIEPYIKEFTCVFAEYDDHTRSVRYSHRESEPDDTLHAANYAQLVALKYVHKY
jgi:hypothetical protein